MMQMFEKLPRGASIRDKLEAYSIPEPNSGCWLWLASVGRNGYGRLGSGGKTKRAHRLSYIEYKGPIPEGLCVLHSCDTRSCINPDHLRAGTYAENAQEAGAKGKMWRPPESNGQTHLTWDDVREIRRKQKGGLLYREIAAMFDVSVSTIHLIVQHHTWKEQINEL